MEPDGWEPWRKSPIPRSLPSRGRFVALTLRCHHDDGEPGHMSCGTSIISRTRVARCYIWGSKGPLPGITGPQAVTHGLARVASKARQFVPIPDIPPDDNFSLVVQGPFHVVGNHVRITCSNPPKRRTVWTLSTTKRGATNIPH